MVRLLEAIRHVDPDIRFYQASSSEMFGKVMEVPQTERTPFYPRSPYGVAKAYAHWITINYRESYDLFAASGILFNHGSPRRGLEFVERKVSHGVARIKRGLTASCASGTSTRAATGDSPAITWRPCGTCSNSTSPVTTSWRAARPTRSVSPARSRSIASGSIGRTHVVQDDRFYRPAEVDLLIGDPAKASGAFGWEPRTSFAALVEMMVDADLEAL